MASNNIPSSTLRILLVLFLASLIGSIWLAAGARRGLPARSSPDSPVGWHDIGSSTLLCLGSSGRWISVMEHTHPHVVGFGTWELDAAGHIVALWRGDREGLPGHMRWNPETARLGSLIELRARWHPRVQSADLPHWTADVGPDGGAPEWAQYPFTFERIEEDPWWTRVR